MSIFHVGDYLKNCPKGTGHLDGQNCNQRLKSKVLDISGIQVERRNVWAYLEIDRLYELISRPSCLRSVRSKEAGITKLWTRFEPGIFETGHFRYLTSRLRPVSKVASSLRNTWSLVLEKKLRCWIYQPLFYGYAHFLCNWCSHFILKSDQKTSLNHTKGGFRTVAIFLMLMNFFQVAHEPSLACLKQRKKFKQNV